MTYPTPPHSAVDFALDAGGQYQTPTHAAADFDLAEWGEPLPPPILPSRVPGLLLTVGTGWRHPGEKATSAAIRHGTSTPLQIQRSITASDAQAIDAEGVTARHRHADKRDRYAGTPWGTPQGRDNTMALPNGKSQERDAVALRTPWGKPSAQLDSERRVRFKVITPVKDSHRRLGFRSIDVLGRPRTASDRYAQPRAIVDLHGADLAFLRQQPDPQSRTIPSIANLPIGAPRLDFAAQPVEQTLTARHQHAEKRDAASGLPWGPSGARDTSIGIVYPDYDGPVTPPGEPTPAEQKETYIIVNSVNVKRVSDSIPIDMRDITISLDADAWAWKLTGTVIGKAGLAMIEPGPGGLIDIEVELNGHTFVFMVESYRGDRRHANETYTIQGISRTQLLAAPYSPTISDSNGSDIQAQQVIDDLLDLTGFTIAWDTTPSWVIDAGALSYQGQSPLAVARQIALAAGAILVPSPDSDELTLQPRLKVSPWALAAAPMTEIDAQIPIALVSSIAVQFNPSPLYDSAYISGTNVGVAGLVTLDGTGGTAPAPDIFDDLMTDTDVLTERGRQIIGASGNRGLVSLTLPVPESATAPGLLVPGMVVEAVEGIEKWRGYVLGTRITAPRSGAEKIEQSVQVVRFYEH